MSPSYPPTPTPDHFPQQQPSLDTTSAPPFSRANRRFWNADAEIYHQQHPEYLSGFYWCPEMLSEEDSHILGDLRNKCILEIGCGSAPCSRWLARKEPRATVIGFDLSEAMLRQALTIEPSTGAHLVHADATALPFADDSFDTVFSAFGAIPFVPDLSSVFGGVARVLKRDGLFAYSVAHPMRWVFPDDPSEAGLIATTSYFEREYIEYDDEGVPSYAEFQHTFSDHVAALTANHFRLHRVIEPEWPATLTQTWGQWSPLRGRIFPGTAIFIASLA